MLWLGCLKGLQGSRSTRSIMCFQCLYNLRYERIQNLLHSGGRSDVARVV